MNYKLTTADQAKEREKGVLGTAWRRLVPLMAQERTAVIIALCAIGISSATSLIAPVIIARTIDTYIQGKNFSGVLLFSGVLFAVFVVGVIASYVQVRTMGGVGRRVLFNLRNAIFEKLEELPLSFFHQNKAGDLISRINNDTDKLNQFFAQAFVQFIGNSVLIVGTGITLLTINPRLGAAALVPAAVVVVLTWLLGPWVRRTSLRSLQKLGGMSGEIQESLINFKVIVAFNRLDYFRTKFKEVNDANYAASVSAGIASNTLTPLYTLASTTAQLVVLAYGIHLIGAGSFTVGLLIGFILYVNNFYMPLRQLASIWSSLQLALAGLDRISEVLALESNLETVTAPASGREGSLLAFDHVSFGYSDGPEILHDISITLEKGKTYALVGPTGGGKTTTASLMARLYDPVKGTIYLDGRDLRSYPPAERVRKIGFILQEPFLFTGTVKENILYGNEAYQNLDAAALTQLIIDKNFTELLERFDQGLETKVTPGGTSISLGQKQLIAFMRAALREPELLILDEATANIDTVTEQQLESILRKLPASTTKVIIAHRLNTIEDADEIFFVNAGSLQKAGTMQQAVDMLLHGKRSS